MTRTTLSSLFLAAAVILAASTATAAPSLQGPAEVEPPAASASVTVAELAFPLEPTYATVANRGLRYACFPANHPAQDTCGTCPSGTFCGILVTEQVNTYCIASGAQCVPRCDISVYQAKFCPPSLQAGGETVASLEDCDGPAPATRR